MAGFTTLELKSAPDGGIDLDALRAAVGPNTAGLMLTNPSTLGMFEKHICEISERIRHDLYRKITYLSSAQTDAFGIPSLESRLTSDTYNLHQMFGMMQRLGVRAPILLLGGILVTMALEPVLSLILVLILPFIALVVAVVSKKSIPCCYHGTEVDF